MYSELKTSSISERTKRMKSGNMIEAREIHGSTRCASPSSVKYPDSQPSKFTVSPRPNEGNQPSSIEKTYISMMAVRNTGMDIPTLLNAITALVKILLDESPSTLQRNGAGNNDKRGQTLILVSPPIYLK